MECHPPDVAPGRASLEAPPRLSFVEAHALWFLPLAAFSLCVKEHESYFYYLPRCSSGEPSSIIENEMHLSTFSPTLFLLNHLIK